MCFPSNHRLVETFCWAFTERFVPNGAMISGRPTHVAVENWWIMPLTRSESGNNLQNIWPSPDRPSRFSTVVRPVLTPFKRYPLALVIGTNTLQGSTTGCTGHRLVQRICRVILRVLANIHAWQGPGSRFFGGGFIMQFCSIPAPGAASARPATPPLAHAGDTRQSSDRCPATAPAEDSGLNGRLPATSQFQASGRGEIAPSRQQVPLRSAPSPNARRRTAARVQFGGRGFG